MAVRSTILILTARLWCAEAASTATRRVHCMALIHKERTVKAAGKLDSHASFASSLPLSHTSNFTSSAIKTPEKVDVTESEQVRQQEHDASSAQQAGSVTPEAVTPAKADKETAKQTSSVTAKKMTMAEQDEDLRRRMAERVGDGGEAGIEYEDGQPVAMKRGVRENMFRYI